MQNRLRGRCSPKDRAWPYRAMAPKVKAGAKAAGKAKAVAKAASPEPVAPPPKVAGPEKLSVFDAETNLNFVEDEDWAALAAATPSADSAMSKVLEAVLLLMGDTDTSWGNAAAALQKPEVSRHILWTGRAVFCLVLSSSVLIWNNYPTFITLHCYMI